MAVKVLIDAKSQHFIADVQQVENKDTGEVVAYWVKHPRVVSYERKEDGQLSVGLHNPCPIATDTEYAMRVDHIVSILDPLPEVAERWQAEVYPSEAVIAELDAATEEEAEGE